MKLAAVLALSLLAAPAFAQDAPVQPPLPEGSYRVLPKDRAAPPAVTLEAEPETFDNSPLIVCRRPGAPQTDQQSDKQADKESAKPCRLAPPRKERHPDYGKGKFYPLIPA